jgi:hypothetical protein
MNAGKDLGVLDYDAVLIGKLLLMFWKSLLILFLVTK